MASFIESLVGRSGTSFFLEGSYTQQELLQRASRYESDGDNEAAIRFTAAAYSHDELNQLLKNTHNPMYARAKKEKFAFAARHSQFTAAAEIEARKIKKMNKLRRSKYLRKKRSLKI